MFNFYPGPSKIHADVKVWAEKAFDTGILEQNHRSTPFMELLKNTLHNFKKSQNIPEDYKVVFTSSATECWEILNQSLLHGKVQFLYNGAFGKKWFKYAVTNNTPFIKKIRGSRFEIDQTIANVEVDEDNDCICLVQCETSNGTAVNSLDFKSESLVLIDATSSLGGVSLEWHKGDAWLCSTQKCLGLPSGMGIMVLSPRAILKAKELDEKNHYNSLLPILENFDKFQTHYTPNILLIYLLNEVSKNIPKIKDLDESIDRRSKMIYEFISQNNHLTPLISTKEVRAKTVIAISAKENIIRQIHEKAQKNQIILGQGYGEWKNNSFRIANFPAHTDEDFIQLKAFLSTI